MPDIDFSDLPDQPTTATQPVPVGRGGVDLSDLPDQPKPSALTRAFLAAREATGEGLVGAVKGMGSTAIGFGQAVAPVLRKIPFVKDYVATPEQFTAARNEFTTPTNTSQKVGKFAEQTAEFLIPGEAATKTAKGLQVAKRLVSMGISPARARLAAGLTEGAVQAAGAFWTTKAQGNEGATEAALISGALPVAGAAIETLYPAIKAGAVSKMQQFVARAYKPEEMTKRLEQVTADAATDLLNMPVQRTWQQWRSATAKGREAAGADLSAALKGPLGDTPIQKAPLINALDDLVATKAKHVAGLTPAAKGQMTGKTAVYNPQLVKAVDELKEILNQYPADIPARQLHDIKQTWQRAVFPIRDSRNPVASIAEQLTTAQKEARMRGSATINAVLEQTAPQLSQLDDAVAHAIRLDQLVKRLQGRAKIKPSTAAALYAAGGALGYAGSSAVGAESYGGHIVGAHLGYATARMLKLALESPQWQTLSPRMRNALAEAIATGRVRQVRRIVAPIVAGIAGQASGSTTPAESSALSASE